MIIEASGRIAGDHTWSFNLSDIPDYLQDWIKPFIAYQWPRYEVRFPEYSRTLEIPYCTGNSDTLRACVQPFIEEGRLIVMLNAPVSEVETDRVILENGDILSASCVLDARGFKPNPDVILGYQKFVGHTIKTKTPHGLDNPIIMDATVEQLGGYRFVYCLPFSGDEVLVEDTYYTDGPELSENEVAARIKAYIQAQGWQVESIIRREKGVLPITLAASKGAWSSHEIGIRGGFYHAVTGYSLPNAVSLADDIAEEVEDGDLDMLDRFICMKQKFHVEGEYFFRLLNRMLFRAARPGERYKVLQRFYRLPEGLIKRFYAGCLTRADKIRILTGKPPVPISKALAVFSERAFIRREREKDQA